MTWTKLSDDFADDCWTLSDEAFRLHTEGLVWSNRKLLNCRIPEDDVRRFARHPESVNELLAAGWWSYDGDAYVIRHHASYQRDKDDVLRQQENSRANGKKGGRPKRERWNEETQSLTQVGNPVANPVMNLKGQDRTGKDRPAVEALETSGYDDAAWLAGVLPGDPAQPDACPACVKNGIPCYDHYKENAS